MIDFKTDEVRSDEEARSVISQNGYDRQLARYARAIESQLGGPGNDAPRLSAISKSLYPALSFPTPHQRSTRFVFCYQQLDPGIEVVLFPLKIRQLLELIQ